MDVPVLFIVVMLGVLAVAVMLGEWGRRYMEVPVSRPDDRE
jgi:hypothetical protein